jgi:hypothetical protein
MTYHPASTGTDWQESLDSQFLQRLLRALHPGVLNDTIAQDILRRTERMTNRLPLLITLMQRQAGLAMAEGNAIPIVYAQPPERVRVNSETPLPPGQPQSQPLKVIQAKMIQPSAINPIVPPIERSIASPSPAVPFPNPISAAIPTVDRPIVSATPRAPAINSSPAIAPQLASKSDSISRDFLSQPTIAQAKSIQKSIVTEKVSFSSSPSIQNTINSFSQNVADAIAPDSRPVIQPRSLPSQKTIQNISYSNPQIYSSSVTSTINRSSNSPLTIVSISSGASPPRHNTNPQTPRSFPASSMDQPAMPMRVAEPLRNSPETSSEQQIPTQAIPAKIIELLSPPTPPLAISQPQIDVEALVNQVERKMMRRLVVERERRGQKWH